MSATTDNFKSEAQNFLNNLVTQLESIAPHLDVEDDQESLTLSIENKVFLLTLNSPLKQIWYASPLSGAHHYVKKNARWLSTRNENEDLLERLSSEITLLSHSPVGLKYYD